MSYTWLAILYNLWLENGNAILALPTSVKLGVLAVIGITFAYGLAKKLVRLVKLSVTVFVVYWFATTFGIF